MRIGFIGLGNLGAKLAGSLQRNGFDLAVHDLDSRTVAPFVERGARWASSPKALAETVDATITCLPSPAASRAVMESDDGVIAGLSAGKLWIEMSTTDEAELRRLAAAVEAGGAQALECPVSGGCHRAATGNISIFVGGARPAFEMAFPALRVMGRKILHVGPLGAASALKVITNFLASTHLVALGEALMVAKRAGLDLATAYEGIAISSGNSFVHETESQVILNGSYNIGFTMDLVVKDTGLFDELAQRLGVPCEVSPLIRRIFEDGLARYGARAWSSGIVRRIEDALGEDLRAPGFPAELIDTTAEAPGEEVVVARAEPQGR